MEFQKHRIVIPLQRKGEKVVFDRIIDATVGIGSGLAYHHPQLAEGEDTESYTITHIASGLNVGMNIYFAVTEQQAQYWLKRVAQITDWNVGREEIIQAPRGINIVKQIEHALNHACREAV